MTTTSLSTFFAQLNTPAADRAFGTSQLYVSRGSARTDLDITFFDRAGRCVYLRVGGIEEHRLNKPHRSALCQLTESQSW